MDIEILKTVAGVGGIAGIGLAVFFSLAKDIIAKALGVGKERAYKLLRLIIVCSFVLGLVSILAWAGITLFESSRPEQVITIKGKENDATQTIKDGSSGGKQTTDIEGDQNRTEQSQ